jgi:DNA helicase-2/ATP-dependent DNA helicase PcrA
VFITGMEEGVFPHSRSLGSDSELEEERRLAYVGMTRAKEELNLLHAHRRSVFGTPNFNRRSRFLDEIPTELLDAVGEYNFGHGGRTGNLLTERGGSYRSGGATVTPTPAVESTAPTWIAPFQTGQRVQHPKFGMGVVVACNPVRDDVEVTVAFPGVVGVKKLVQKLAKLEAV